MDSFLSLFDPNAEDNDNEWDDNDEMCIKSVDGYVVKPRGSFSCLPPEPQVGNVEYKLKLVNPSKHRFEHLVTQMKWRLREGQGEAIYEMGVEDNGALAGLSQSDMSASLHTLEKMAQELGATITVLRQRTLPNTRAVAEVLVRKIPDNQNNIDVRVAVMGGADAGKSTLLGVLTQGQLDNGRGRARLNMFRHLHEVQSGRTSSISHEILGFDSKGHVINYNYSELMTAEEICETSSKLITFLDLAGHRKYLRTTVLGLTGYSPHHVMLVISGSAGILGMTHEHLELAMALDVPLFIVISKIDLRSPQEVLSKIQSVLKSIGCRRVPLLVKNEDDVITAGANQLTGNIVPIFCISSVSGDGLELLKKFLYLLPPGISLKEREKLEQKPADFQIDETFKVAEVGQVVGGLLISGFISEGSTMHIGPLKDGAFMPVKVRSVHRNKAPCRMVRAGQSASLCLDRLVPGLRHGMVILGTY